MNAHTLAARETVGVIRESLCVSYGPNVLDAEMERAYGHLRQCFGLDGDYDYERIEMWARLLADVAARKRSLSL